MKVTAHSIKVDGAQEDKEFDRDLTLEELQGYVGGYIEVVYVRFNHLDQIMVVDEEGLLKGKKENSLASSIAHQFIVGDVVIVSHMD